MKRRWTIAVNKCIVEGEMVMYGIERVGTRGKRRLPQGGAISRRKRPDSFPGREVNDTSFTSRAHRDTYARCGDRHGQPS